MIFVHQSRRIVMHLWIDSPPPTLFYSAVIKEQCKWISHRKTLSVDTAPLCLLVPLSPSGTNYEYNLFYSLKRKQFCELKWGVILLTRMVMLGGICFSMRECINCLSFQVSFFHFFIFFPTFFHFIMNKISVIHSFSDFWQ